MSFDILLQYGIIIGAVVLPLTVIPDLLRVRRSPAAMLAWLLGVVLLPYLVVPLYFVFSGRKLPLGKRRRRRKAQLRLADAGELPEDRTVDLDRLLRRLHLPGASNGNRVTLERDGMEAWRAVCRIIDGAQRSLHVAIYILADDDSGRDVLARLAERARLGVDVRLLVDGVGSMDLPDAALAELRAAGGHIAYFNPLIVGVFRGLANLRNHRKIVIADGAVAWSGGRNFSVDYLRAQCPPDCWTDLSFTIAGPAAQIMQEVFWSDWTFASGRPPDNAALPPPQAAGQSVVQIVPSGPDVPDDPLFAALLTASFAARKRLWLISPYFVPDDSLMHAWLLAARLGVDVRIVVPQRSDSRLVDMARMTYLRELQAAGARILRHQGPTLHMKAFVIDDAVSGIGTANMDARSLFLNFEVTALLYSRADIDAVAEIAEALMRDCQEGIRPVGRYRGLISGAARLFAPLL
ncbi:MAG: phospholipase D-like domain-containing protein [Reyranellaceae bacterium]